MTNRESIDSYNGKAEKLVKQYESSPFAEVYAPIMDVFPTTPCKLLDLGAGSGRDSAALVKKGFTAVTVEPNAEMRKFGQMINNDKGMTWVDDALPELGALKKLDLEGPYPLIISAGLWMHFDDAELDASMKRVAELLAPGGRFVLSLRHGPVPAGRKMFSTQPEVIIELGKKYGLAHVKHILREDLHGREEVKWTFMCLEKPAA
ncbi:class I SAM-dependent methyltransferase [Desulfovibrio sp. OttesenSCG-928-C06]|nr:class I SAM-dependent methyltransferase [Desulfovibrio sp. OttesenSCG-928-C06]